MRLPPQIGAIRFESGRIDCCLVHQENRDIVPYRINPPALAAFQAFLIALDNQWLPAGRTNQDFEQFLGNHADILRRFVIHHRVTETQECQLRFR